MFSIRHSNGIEIITAPALETYPEVVHGFSTRNGGISRGPFRSLNLGMVEGDTLKNILVNRKRFCNTLSFAPSNLLQSEQVHGTNIAIVEANDPPGQVDALITNQRNLFLSVRVADCAPVLLYEPEKHVVAAVHAGWRGTANAIIASTVKAMVDRFDVNPEQIVASIGPVLSQCCYEIQNDVARHFSAEEVVRRKGGLFLDLVGAIRNRLRSAGLAETNIHASDFCTACQPDLFYSHRRDRGVTGRMLGVIGLNHHQNSL